MPLSPESAARVVTLVGTGNSVRQAAEVTALIEL